MNVEFTAFSCICGETDLVAGPVPNSSTNLQLIVRSRLQQAENHFRSRHDGDHCLWNTKVFSLQVPEYLLTAPQFIPQG